MDLSQGPEKPFEKAIYIAPHNRQSQGNKSSAGQGRHDRLSLRLIATD
jgi:hypothetical protein